MFKKAIDFLKYNNAALLILVVILLLSTGALATETGRAALGQQQTSVQGEDNTLLVTADLANLDMDFSIEKIEADEDYYYVTYTYIDLVKRNNVWQYQMQEKTRKVTIDLKEDLGTYLAEELGEEYDARIKDLTSEQAQAQETGETKRVEVSQFSGLIGATLDLAGNIFPGYEAVTVQEMPSPILPPSLAYLQVGTGTTTSVPDNLTRVYEDYIDSNDPDADNVFGDLDNCPDIFNPGQSDADFDGIGNICDDDFGLVPEIATTTEEIATSTESVATSTEESAEEATTTEEVAVEEEPDVEIIELPIDDTATGT